MTEPAPNKKAGAWWFEGTWTTPIPPALVFDHRLTPGDKLLWIAMRCTMTQPSTPIKPTYDYLMEACSLSRSALSRSLKALRLTGWAAAKRISKNDYIEGQVYSLFDADQSSSLLERPDVQAFVVRCQSVPGRIGVLASSIAEQYQLPNRKLLPPDQGSSNLGLPSSSGGSNLELPADSSSSNLVLPRRAGSSTMLPPENQQLTPSSNLLLPRARSSSCSSTTTTAGVRANARVYAWPEDLSELSRRSCANDLGSLDLETAQAVLDELASKLPSGSVKNPTVYLRTLIAKALAGTFEFTDGGARVAQRRRSVQLATAGVAATPKPLPGITQLTRSAWDATLHELSGEFGAPNVELWLKPLILREQLEELTLFASNGMVLSEVRNKFMPRLKELFFARHPYLRNICTLLGDGLDQGHVA